MQIDRIKSMQGTGIFRQFTWPSTLQEFGHYNLVYGWNGTGKSTLARIFDCLQNRTVPEGTVTLVVDGNEVVGGAFISTTVPIRVFNREFVEKNVLASTRVAQDSPEVPAIFVIGEKNVESQKQADAARNDLQKCEGELIAQRTKKSEASDALEAFCTEQARLIKDLLRGTGSAYNNYNKAGFKTKAEQLTKQNDTSKLILNDAARAERVQKHQSTPREKLTPLAYEFPDLVKIYDDLRTVLARVVTSAVIESLKKDSDAASWIKVGLEKHQVRKAINCLFCDQRLPATRLDALNAHFNDAYQTLLADLEKRIQRLDTLEEQRSSLAVPKSTETYDHLTTKHKSAAEKVDVELTTLKTALAFVHKQLIEKQNAPFEARSVDQNAPALDADAINRLNAVIAEHNKHSDDFAKQVKKAREELEASHVTGALAQFKKHQKTLQDADATVKATEDNIQQLNQKIAKLDKDLREHRKPADELNRDLQNYLGHPDIQLSISSTGYKITRHGAIATRLSEGEQTAIALLYFLKTLMSKDFKLAEGIVVLDDPVCSLDANALFSAFGFIKERTKTAKQLFVLTHNFAFFRQVRSWFHKLRGPDKKSARFYMLRCLTIQGHRQAELCWLDPLLETYESDYHYIFSRVRNLANGPAQSLDEYYGAPNLARKLMESFLAFRVPSVPHGNGHTQGDIWAKLETLAFDEHKKARILRFLNDYSHSGAIGGDQQDFTALNETPAVLADLLAMIEQADKSHYDGMVALLPQIRVPLAANSIQASATV
jgi:wobble nucleotide-excising tRNase